MTSSEKTPADQASSSQAHASTQQSSKTRTSGNHEHPSGDEPSIQKPTQKKPWTPLRIVISVVLVAVVVDVLIVPLFSDFSSTWDKIRAINPWIMIVAAVVEIFVWALYGATIRLLLPPKHRAALWVFVGTSFASKGISHVVPAGAATTAAVDYTLLHQAGVPTSELAFSFTAAGAMTTITLNVLLGISLVFAIPQIPQAHSSHTFTAALVFGVVLVLGLSILAALLIRNPEGMGRLAAKLIGWIPGVKSESVEAAIVHVGHELQQLLADRHRLRLLIVISIAKWLIGALAFWIVLTAVGKAPNLFAVFVAFALANVSSAIPLTPGGIGVFEAVMISTLVAFGVPHAEAAAGVLAFRLINFWLPIPLGAIAYVMVDRATKRGKGVTPARRKQLLSELTS